MKRITTLLFGFAMMMVVMMPKGADAISISPPTFDFSLNPGDTVLDVIKIYNEEDTPITLYPFSQNFTNKEDEGGAPNFYEADEVLNGRELSQWITYDEEPISIGPGQRANLSFAINIPEDAQPGGHFGAILLGTNPPAIEGGGVAVASQITSLILVRVSGEVRELGQIAEFGFVDPQVSYNYLPVDFFMRFENYGNSHLRPVGNLFITNWRGKQVASIEINNFIGSVLPQSIRRFTFGWQKSPVQDGWSELQKEWHNFAVGKHTATLVLNYGQDNKIVTDVREFYVWPWRLLSIYGVLAVLVIVLIVLWKRRYDRVLFRRFERINKKRQNKN